MSDELSLRVLRAVADREGVDPVDLEPPLHDVIDPIALDDLFASRSGDGGSVEFSYRGYRVVASSDGRVRVDEPNPTAEPNGVVDAAADD